MGPLLGQVVIIHVLDTQCNQPEAEVEADLMRKLEKIGIKTQE